MTPPATLQDFGLTLRDLDDAIRDVLGAETPEITDLTRYILHERALRHAVVNGASERSQFILSSAADAISANGQYHLSPQTKH